jgi:hypothetical protein
MERGGVFDGQNEGRPVKVTTAPLTAMPVRYNASG